MKRTILSLLSGIFFCTPAFLSAQDYPYQILESSRAEVEFFASNYGIFGLNVVEGAPGFFYPRGTGNYYIYGAGLWIGAQKEVEPGTMRKYSFSTYNPTTGSSWAVPGEFDNDQAARSDLYHSVNYDEKTGAPISGDAPNWPLWLRPGESLTPMNYGTFVPMNEDRTAGGDFDAPAFMPDVDDQFIARFHDGELKRYEFGAALAKDLGYPIGLQFQERIYGWETGPLKNVVILAYEIVNVSSDTLRNCVIAQITDIDIGDNKNDRAMLYGGTAASRSIVGWSGQEDFSYGTLLTTVLEAPLVDVDNFVDNSRRVDFQTMGEIFTMQNFSLGTEPQNPEDRYDYMRSGELGTDIGPHDARPVVSAGNFHMAPGDTAHFAIAYSVLVDIPDPQATEAEGEILAAIDRVTRQYYSNGFSAAPPTASGDMELHASMIPNPVSGEGALRFMLTERSDVRVGIHDELGRTRMTLAPGMMEAGTHTLNLNAPDLPAGCYVATIEAEGLRRAVRFVVVR